MNYTPLGNEANEVYTACGVPFRISRDDGMVQSREGDIAVGVAGKSLFMLGMSIRHWEMSDWWGQQEVRGDLSTRVFVGDTIEKLRIEYEDDTLDVIPLIVGVNCWPYDIYFGAREWEKGIYAMEGPYMEPMQSDPAARKLFEDSLRMRLNENEDWEKGTRWVYVHNLRTTAPVKCIHQQIVKAKGVCISAVTLGDEAVEGATDLDFFLKKDWFAAADRFSRMLYQYRDEIPSRVELLPAAEGAPEITFEGSGEADIFTNVYRANIVDMAFGKVTDDGRTHTSSKNTLNYGCYVGFGPYNHFSNYFDNCCTRDVGRTLIELSHYGYGDRTRLASKWLHETLYYPSVTYKLPRWKFDAGVVYGGKGWFHGNEGLCNDGHASIMMAIYSIYQEGYADKKWLEENRKYLKDAADYYLWQLDNAALSHFDRTLYSVSECSNAHQGGYDLYANVISAKALECYARIFEDLGEDEYAQKLIKAAKIIKDGVEERFTMNHPRLGGVYTDTTDDCWTYEYKRFCHALMASDMDGYDLYKDDPTLFDKLERTFDTQKEEYYHPDSGRQMGYGQGYLTSAALILDRYEDYSDCMDSIAHECYHHGEMPYIVPEGVVMNAMHSKWSRNNDLGNGVQQAEIVKCARLLLGIDDMDKKKPLRLVPRLPKNWQGMRAKDFPVFTEKGREFVTMAYARCAEVREDAITALDKTGGYFLKTSGAHWDTARLGPFDSEDITVYGAQKLETAFVQGKYYVYVKENR